MIAKHYKLQCHMGNIIFAHDTEVNSTDRTI